jgi:DNA repair protein RadC
MYDPTDPPSSRSSPTRSLREIPSEQRPRERLWRLGGEALSDAELLAILIRTGLPDRSALDLAAEALAREGGLAGLARREPGQIARLAGFGTAKAAELSAALEIGRRLSRAAACQRPLFGSPERVAAYLLARAADWPQERIGALVLDSRNRLLFDREIVRGSLDAAAASPRDILRRCLVDDGSGFVLYHNHPSGDPTPSRDDVDFTRGLARAAEQIGVRFVDHVVVGREGCVSLRGRGLMT